jgi:hypothetical protein
MADLAKEIAEITARYKHEMVALTERYLKELEALKAQLGREIAATQVRDLKEKIETEGPSYFG